MVDDGSGGDESVLDGQFGIYVAACAAFATANLIDWVKDVVTKKDFARNLGLKVSEFWGGMVDGCRRPNHINQMLSDQMTVDMRRVLQEAMAYGLERQPYDQNQSQKFTPGYFGPDNQYYAWQNLFPSTLTKDTMTPGLVIYFPADKDDFINIAEYVDLTNTQEITRHYQLIQQLLECILPPQKKREPLLNKSVDGLSRIFSGVLKPAAYYGNDPNSKKLKVVTDGVQVMRIVNSVHQEGDMVDLLGTIIFVPDLNQRQGSNVDITSPLLRKPTNQSQTEWMATLPNRLRWLLSKKDRFFISGSRKLDMQKFLGPLTYRRLKPNGQGESDSEDRAQLMRERQERQQLEQHLYALEVAKDEELARAYEESQQQLERLSRVLAEREQSQRQEAERAGQYDPETGQRRFVGQQLPSRIPVRRSRGRLPRRDSSPELLASVSPPSPLVRTRSNIELATVVQPRLVYATAERLRSPSPTMAVAEERVWRAQSVPITRSPSPEAGGAAAVSVSPPLRAARGRFTVVRGAGSDTSPPGGDEVHSYEYAPRVAVHPSAPMDECKTFLEREIAEASARADACRRRSYEAQAQLESQRELTARQMTTVSEEGSPSPRPSSPAYSDCSIDEEPLSSVMVV